MDKTIVTASSTNLTPIANFLAGNFPAFEPPKIIQSSQKILLTTELLIGGGPVDYMSILNANGFGGIIGFSHESYDSWSKMESSIITESWTIFLGGASPSSSKEGRIFVEVSRDETGYQSTTVEVSTFIQEGVFSEVSHTFGKDDEGQSFDFSREYGVEGGQKYLHEHSYDGHGYVSDTLSIGLVGITPPPSDFDLSGLFV